MAFTVPRAVDWPRIPVLLVIFCILFTVQVACGQGTDETTQQTNARIEQLANLGDPSSGDTPLGSGDLIHVEVFDVPELNRDIRISTTGNISFPLLREKIDAVGLTPTQLEQAIEGSLIQNGLVSHPQVSVLVKEQNSQPVTVIGAVGHPMTYQVIRPMRLLELIAIAGGISDNAGSVILITRPAEMDALRPLAGKSNRSVSDDSSGVSGAKTIRIRLQDLLNAENTNFNIRVYGGDVVNVPPGGIVYVMGGGVQQQGGYVVQSHGEQISVLKAVALAHGLGGFAKPDEALLYRVNPVTGQRDAIPVHIKQIEKNKTEDVAMKSNDVLYVPDSLAKKIAAKGAEAAVGIGTGLLVYRGTNP